MIRRITLKNYMAHVDTVLELADGLNVLVGPNNCGKSAVVSALHLLATLPTREGDYMMRHGTSDCAVTVETAEGDVLCWKRGKGTPKLVINGEELTRLANDSDHMLKRLHEHLRLPQVIGEGRECFDVHFAMQKDPIFLLGKESQAATFFASSSDASRLLEMQARFKEKVRKRKQESAACQTERVRLAGELQRLAPLDDVAPALKRLHAEAEELRLGAEREEKLAIELAALGEAAADRRLVDFECRALQQLQDPPTLQDTGELEKTLEEVRRRLTELRLLTAEDAALRPLEQPPVLTDELPLELLTKSLRETGVQCAELRGECAALAPLNEPPELSETEQLSKLAAELRTVSARLVAETQRGTVLSRLQDVPQLEDAVALEESLQTLRRAGAEAKTIRLQCALLDALPPVPELQDEEPVADMRGELLVYEREVEDARAAFVAAEKEFEAYVASNPQCPHCGGPLQATGVHHHA